MSKGKGKERGNEVKEERERHASSERKGARGKVERERMERKRLRKGLRDKAKKGKIEGHR